MAVGTVLERLAGIADELVALDVSGLADVAVADSYVELRRAIDRLESVAARLLVGVEGRGIAYGQGATSVWAWAQWQTGQRWPDAKASFDAGVACEQLPLTAKAWAQGEISATAARTICRGLRAGYEDVYAAIEEPLVHYAAERNLCELDGLIGYYRKHCDALDDREPCERNGVYLAPVGERWDLRGDLDALAGKTLHEAIDAAIDPDTDPDDTRNPARRRADALARIARFFLDHEDLPLEAGEAPHVSLTIPWETIMSWLPIPIIPHDVTDLATLISRAQRDQLLCDCNIARIILGPDSQPLDVGRALRTAPRWMRRAVAHRDQHCRYPGCDRRPNRCEVHHVIAWWAGGNTALYNLVLLCPFHHHVIHRKGWTATFDGTTLTITNSDGRTIGTTTPARAP